VSRAVLFDSTRCIGCRQCEQDCSARWKLPYNEKIAAEEFTSAHKLTTVRTYGERFSRKLCMHCQEPACVSVCPVGALEKTARGPVVYHEERCMGCRYCMIACPFQVPTYEWNSRLPIVRKCDLCSDRVGQGGVTRCTEGCPTEATVSGGRDELIAAAKRRLAESPAEYNGRIYGIKEAGGTSVLFLSAVPFEQIGLNTAVPEDSLPHLTWQVLSHVPDVVACGGVLLGGVWWITHRRDEVARAEGTDIKGTRS
jgi:formate dehydrogenase iron-sulfur subunit